MFTTVGLKILACVFMLVDHIAYVLIPQTSVAYILMRIIGRLSAPLFWFCFAEGFKHTRNRKMYIVRLVISALIMGLGNIVLNRILNYGSDITFLTPNMFLSLGLMAIVLYLIDKMKNHASKGFCFVSLILAILISLIVGLCAEYGFLVVCSILCMYYIKSMPLKCVLLVISTMFICIVLHNPIQFFSILAILLISNYQSRKPKCNLKWFFYAFYPMHFWILLIIRAAIW